MYAHSNLYITSGAQSYLDEKESLELMKRFISNDWGDTHKDDCILNDEALRTKDRIVAKYIVRETPLFIIADPGHKIITILLASEY